MDKQRQHITYTIVDPNKGRDFKKAIKEMVVEKLLLIHRNALPTTN